MPELPSDVVARAYAAVIGRDLETYLACFTEDGVMHVPPAVPFAEGGRLQGREEMRRFVERTWSFYGAGFSVRVNRIAGRGDHRALEGVMTSRATDGRPCETPFRDAITLRDGLICEIRTQVDSGPLMRAVHARLATGATDAAGTEVA